jgi:hypothetical protein
MHCNVVATCADLGGTSDPPVVALQPGSSLFFNALTLVNAMPLDSGVCTRYHIYMYELVIWGQ